ncbi:hypothetical protein Hanom_Chr13g01195671 [Helianthus anomalus]
MTNPSLCKEALKGFGPPAEAVRLKAGGRESLEDESARLKEEAAAAMKKVQVAEEGLAKQNADFMAYKRTEQWVVAVGHQQVRSLTHLIAEKRKLWKEPCARENEKFYHLRQEINNLKVANVAHAKEKGRG